MAWGGCGRVAVVEPGELILAGTPIGDAADATPSLLRALEAADVVAAEDTRRVRDLARRLGVSLPGRVLSYFDGNEAARARELVEELRSGRTVVVVTDAGMPAVSDPGYRVVAAAAEAGIRVRVVPGPSAVLAALAVSGLPSDRFCFEGFLPRKSGTRRRRLAGLASEERTMVFFEAPHRLAELLHDAADVLGGDRPAVVCREPTKTHEEVLRGNLAGLAEWALGEVRGEITIVIAGATGTVDASDGVEEVLELVADGLSFKDAVAAVATSRGLNRGTLYQAALERRKATR